ncbi:BTB domain-containing protein [Mycena venus]|uniref:BTB domain-containing protein n=1 Tax=Mycena venus TaxID=2733690 RepID=A0A8H6XQG6_9AGAR|nr:BTB domain-containing protein [Mycena venus]
METPTDLVRNSEFWFEDGTIILRVENTLYRVYRGLLASRSTVFRDTFSMPQPQIDEERDEIDGCPVVQLHDKEKDFTCFLKALLQYGSYRSTPVSGLAELSSVLRLSDKYDVSLLRESMTSILYDLYPTSLSNWLTRSANIPPGYRISGIDDILVLNLAREMNIPSILPGAMYQASKAHGLDILYGRSARIEHENDRRHCVTAIPELIVARRRVLSGYLVNKETADGCDAEEGECDAERLRWLALDLPREDYPDPLADTIPWEDFDVCSACLEAAKEVYNAARQEFWDDLPDIFNLGSWADLLA